MTKARTISPVKPNPQASDAMREQLRARALEGVPEEMLTEVDADALARMSAADRAKTVREWQRRHARVDDGTEHAIREAVSPTVEPETATIVPLPTSYNPTPQQTDSPTLAPEAPTQPKPPAKPRSRGKGQPSTGREPAAPATPILEDLSQRWSVGAGNMRRLDITGPQTLENRLNEFKTGVFLKYRVKVNESRIITRAVERWLGNNPALDKVGEYPGTSNLSTRVPASVRESIDTLIYTRNAAFPYRRIVCQALDEYLTYLEAELLPSDVPVTSES